MTEPAVYRILDANLNRAREALRVLEEYVRFVKDDAILSARTKALRHRMKEIADALGPEKLLSARASETDVGRDIPSPSRETRTDPRAVAVASCKRLQEALRNLEEYSTGVDQAASDLAGQIRFDAYQLEKELFLTTGGGAFQSVRLYLLIGSDLCPAEKIVSLSARLLDAGVDCVQLREKHLTDRQIFALAGELSELCRSKGKLFIVNDRADVAKAVAANGVHVGQDDLPVEAARMILPDGIVGLSTHTLDQVSRAIDQRPTYVAVGPAYETETKPHEPAAGLDFVRHAVTMLDEAGVLHVAIGGIRLDNIEQVLAAGARRVAVASAILQAEDPAAAAGRFAELLARQGS